MYILLLDFNLLATYDRKPSLNMIARSLEDALLNITTLSEFNEHTYVEYKLEGSVKDYSDGSFQDTFDLLYSEQSVELVIDSEEYFVQLKRA